MYNLDRNHTNCKHRGMSSLKVCTLAAVTSVVRALLFDGARGVVKLTSSAMLMLIAQLTEQMKPLTERLSALAPAGRPRIQFI